MIFKALWRMQYVEEIGELPPAQTSDLTYKYYLG